MVFQRITRTQFEQRLAELCFESGSMEFPRRIIDRHILWKSIVLGLEPAVEYSEGGIDECIQHWLKTIGRTVSRDRFNIRRQLVDEGYPTRTSDDSVYCCAAKGPGTEHFDADVEYVKCDTVVRKQETLKREKGRAFFGKRLQQDGEQDSLFQFGGIRQINRRPRLKKGRKAVLHDGLLSDHSYQPFRRGPRRHVWLIPVH